MPLTPYYRPPMSQVTRIDKTLDISTDPDGRPDFCFYLFNHVVKSSKPNLSTIIEEEEKEMPKANSPVKKPAQTKTQKRIEKEIEPKGKTKKAKIEVPRK